MCRNGKHVTVSYQDLELLQQQRYPGIFWKGGWKIHENQCVQANPKSNQRAFPPGCWAAFNLTSQWVSLPLCLSAFAWCSSRDLKFFIRSTKWILGRESRFTVCREKIIKDHDYLDEGSQWLEFTRTDFEKQNIQGSESSLSRFVTFKARKYNFQVALTHFTLFLEFTYSKCFKVQSY